MAKSDKKRVNSIITVTRWDNKLKFAFTGVGDFTFDPDKVSAENRARAMVHGFEQRVRDAAALSVDRDTGKSATPTAKFEAAKRIADHLMSGATEWNLKPAATGGLDAGLVIMAIMRVFRKTLNEAETVVTTTMSKKGIERTAALKLWANSKQVAAAMLEIKTERLSTTEDADDLLDEIMGEESDLDDEDGGEGEGEEESDEDDEEQ